MFFSKFFFSSATPSLSLDPDLEIKKLTHPSASDSSFPAAFPTPETAESTQPLAAAASRFSSASARLARSDAVSSSFLSASATAEAALCAASSTRLAASAAAEETEVAALSAAEAICVAGLPCCFVFWWWCWREVEKRRTRRNVSWQRGISPCGSASSLTSTSLFSLLSL